MQRIPRQDKVLAGGVASEAQRQAVAGSDDVTAVFGIGRFVPEPTLPAGAVLLGLDHHRPADELAFEILLERLSPTMLGLARSILSDRDLAEEVVQETWLQVIRGLERF